MALILNIDTSTENASVCLAKDELVLLLKINNLQRDHATWLHPAINEIMKELKIQLPETDAIAVTIGPGSYTGLRVGLAAAKGICYALEKPLLAVNTLLVMAHAIKNEQADLLCPMIDARRMDVFTALYTNKMKPVNEPVAMIINETSFAEELSSKSVCFSGTGSEKFKRITTNRNALFSDALFDASHMISITHALFLKKQFSDLAYIEPTYLKEFYIPAH
jgi:tRNA threonylcarbamoyladenosine biosynthesis protein TsaB